MPVREKKEHQQANDAEKAEGTEPWRMPLALRVLGASPYEQYGAAQYDETAQRPQCTAIMRQNSPGNLQNDSQTNADIGASLVFRYHGPSQLTTPNCGVENQYRSVSLMYFESLMDIDDMSQRPPGAGFQSGSFDCAAECLDSQMPCSRLSTA